MMVGLNLTSTSKSSTRAVVPTLRTTFLSPKGHLLNGFIHDSVVKGSEAASHVSSSNSRSVAFRVLRTYRRTEPSIPNLSTTQFSQRHSGTTDPAAPKM